MRIKNLVSAAFLLLALGTSTVSLAQTDTKQQHKSETCQKNSKNKKDADKKCCNKTEKKSDKAQAGCKKRCDKCEKHTASSKKK